MQFIRSFASTGINLRCEMTHISPNAFSEFSQSDLPAIIVVADLRTLRNGTSLLSVQEFGNTQLGWMIPSALLRPYKRQITS